MKGLRTIGANMIGAFLVPFIVARLKQWGIDLTPEQQLELTAQIFAVGNLVLRYFTNTPIGAQVAGAAVNLDQLKQLVPALYVLLARHQAERRKTSDPQQPKVSP